MKLNKRVAQLRSSLRQNQEEMAKSLGITRSHYNKIENGKMEPTLKLLRKIAKLTNTELVVLLSDVIYPQRIGSKCETRAVLGLEKAFNHTVKVTDHKQRLDKVDSGTSGLSKEIIAGMVEKQRNKTKKLEK